MEYTANRIYDVDLLGTLDTYGQIIQLYGKEAIQNSIKLWLTSFETDFIRNSGRGGYLTKFLYKQMSEDNRRIMQNSIIDGFAQDYEPKAKLLSLDIVPDYINSTWLITLVVYIPEIKDQVLLDLVVRNFV